MPNLQNGTNCYRMYMPNLQNGTNCYGMYMPNLQNGTNIRTLRNVEAEKTECYEMIYKLIETPTFNSIFISCFPVGYREIAVKIFFYLTLVAPVKIPIFMFLLPGLIARA